MAKSSNSYQKRKKELDRQKKKEEKFRKKLDKKNQAPATFEEMIESPDNIQPDDGVDYSGVEVQDEEEN